MREKVFITILICIPIVLLLLLSVKWNTNIYMESTAKPPHDKIDLKLSIDSEIVFDDTLQKNPFSYPTHIQHPLRIGFHTISVSSKKVNLQKEENFFIFLNQHIALYYYGFDTTNIKPVIYIIKRNGAFGYE